MKTETKNKFIEYIQGLPAERVEVDKVLTDEATAALEGQPLKHEDLSTVFKGRNVDAYCKQTGKCLFKLRCNVLPSEVIKNSYEALHKAGEATSDNRGMAGGAVSDHEIAQIIKREGGSGFERVDKFRYRFRKKDGSLSSVTRSKRTNGSIVGYFGKSARLPYCRLTSYTEKNFKKFTKAFPLIRMVSSIYEALMPDSWNLQRKAVESSHQDFIIDGSVFSTVTVNKNFPTALHYDNGDLRGGFGNLVVIRRGKYSGCVTGFPQYAAGCDVQTGDVLLMDVHQLHGNTPMVKEDYNAVRLALVMYYREDIAHCASLKEESRAARELMDKRMEGGLD